MSKKLLFLIPVIVLVITWSYSLNGTVPVEDSADNMVPLRIRVTPTTEGQLEMLDRIAAYRVSEIPPSRVNSSYYYEIPGSEIDFLDTSAISYEVLPHAPTDWNDEDYFSYQEVYDYFILMTLLYPDIAVMESLGVSTRDSVTIWGFKISDNPHIQEDEPDALIDAVIHAREPVNVNVCIALMDSLLGGYGYNPAISNLVDETEIWVVPIKNPEGYLYVETGITNPWWRKNKRDNNENDIFEGVVWELCGEYYPSMPDGVDLNRNYPAGWDSAGSADSCSIVYRGPSNLSENETQMEIALLEREHFVASICFHSFSEYVGYCGEDAAGYDLCIQMAASITREDGIGSYDCFNFFGDGQAYNYMYWEYGVQAFLIETATEFFPSGEERINGIVENNVNGIFTMLNRIHGSSIRGNVRDSQTDEPLVAQVSIDGEVPLYAPRMSEPVHGRFTRLLMPGTYTLRVTKEGYEDYVMSDIVVEDGVPTVIEVPLVNTASDIEDTQADAPPAIRAFSVSQNYPNPFNPSTTLRFDVPESAGTVNVKVSIYDMRGRLIRKLLDEERGAGTHQVHWDGRGERGEPVSSGIYFYQIEAGDFRSSRKMVMSK
jgi:hypothetical protein